MIPPVLTSTQVRKELAATIKTCVDDCTPIVITSRKRRVVMVPLEEWEAMQETQYLLSEPANAARLRHSMEQAARGETTEMTPEDIYEFINAAKNDEA